MVSAPSVRRQRREAARAERQQAAMARRRALVSRYAPIVWIVGAVAALVLVFILVGAVRSWLADPLERGRSAMEAGNFRAARVDLMNAANAQPDNAAIRIDLARTYVALNRASEAQRQLDRAQALGVDMALLRTVRAEAHLLTGDAAAALETLDGPVARSQAADALRIGAQAHYRLGNFAQARDNFARALAQAPGDAALWVAYARYRMAEQDLVDADRAADEARRLAPRSAAALGVKADIVRARGGPIVSIAWYEAAIVLDPDNVPLMLEYAAALGESGRYRDMLVPLRRAAELEPANPRALFLQAVLAARGDELALARMLLGRIDGPDADLPAVLLLRAAVELSLETPVTAAQHASRLLAIQPDNRQARQLLALAQAKVDNPRGAVLTLDAITTQPDADNWSLLLLSQSFGAMGWTSDAIQPLDRATTLVRGAPAVLPGTADASVASNPAGVVRAIRARLAAGAVAEARALATALAQANPGVAAAWILLGDVASAAGDDAAAMDQYQRAAEVRFDQSVMLRLVNVQVRMGNRDAAGTTISAFMARWPENSAAMRVAGAMAAEQGDWTNARFALLAAAERVGGTDALLLAQLARCELELGHVSDALPLARRAYRLLPGNATISGIYGITIARSGGNMQDARDLMDKAVSLAPSDPLLRQWRAEVWE